MYFLYLKNKDGRYYYGIQFTNPARAVEIAIELKEIIPAIMITNSLDNSIFETENGDVTHPENISFQQKPLSESVCQLMSAEEDDISTMIEKRNHALVGSPEFEDLESALIASAIHHDINLYHLGWQQI